MYFKRHGDNKQYIIYNINSHSSKLFIDTFNNILKGGGRHNKVLWRLWLVWRLGELVK